MSCFRRVQRTRSIRDLADSDANRISELRVGWRNRDLIVRAILIERCRQWTLARRSRSRQTRDGDGRTLRDYIRWDLHTGHATWCYDRTPRGADDCRCRVRIFWRVGERGIIAATAAARDERKQHHGAGGSDHRRRTLQGECPARVLDERLGSGELCRFRKRSCGCGARPATVATRLCGLQLVTVTTLTTAFK